MNAIMVALFSALVATFAGTLLLHKYSRILRVRSQSFKFHELRDRLQVLAVERKANPDSSAYRFLQFTLNLCIRNAGAMKLSELLKLSRIIDRKMKVIPSRDVFAELRRENEEVQELAADVFHELGCMLVVNDGLTRLLAKFVEIVAGEMRGVLLKLAKATMKRLAPTHSRAVTEARKYQDLSSEIRNAVAA